MTAQINNEPSFIMQWPQTLFKQGVALLGEKQHQQAEPVFREVTELLPEFPGGYYNLGVCLNALNQAEEALGTFNKVLQLSPAHSGALLNAGKCSMGLEQTEDAIVFFSEVLKVEAESVDALTCRGIAYFYNAQYDLACSDLEAITDDQDAFWIGCYYRGCSLLQLGDAESALAWLNRADSSQPGLAEIAEMRFLTLMQLEKYIDALALMDQMAAEDPSVRQRFAEYIDVARKAVIILAIQKRPK